MKTKNIFMVDEIPSFEFTNYCPNCGKENTIFPKWVGKKRFYVCDDECFSGCGKAVKGITKSEAKRRGLIK